MKQDVCIEFLDNMTHACCRVTSKLNPPLLSKDSFEIWVRDYKPMIGNDFPCAQTAAEVCHCVVTDEPFTVVRLLSR